MYICPKCNAEVEPHGQGRWTAASCQHGHRPYVAGLGDTSEQPFRKAMLQAIAINLGALVLAGFASLVWPSTGFRVVLMVLVLWPLIGLRMLVRARAWGRTVGPAKKLAPKAAGTACGYLMTSGVVIAANARVWFWPRHALTSNRLP